MNKTEITLREERLQYILKKLRQMSKVSSKTLSEELGVSDDTIRRDLHELDGRGLLQKVHGGAVPPAKPAKPYADRMLEGMEKKAALARKSLRFFEDDMVVVLDDGTTNLAVAQALPDSLKATIVTNSLPIAMALTEKPGIHLVMLGGEVFKKEKSVQDHHAMAVLGTIRADLCLIGVCSVHHEVGVCTRYWREGQLKRKMVEASKKVVVLATEDKLDTADRYVVCPYPRLGALVVADRLLGSPQMKPYENDGVAVV